MAILRIQKATPGVIRVTRVDGTQLRINPRATTRITKGSATTGVTSVTAGAGLIDSGTPTNPILDVVANADGSITVNADDVQVGVLATDVQHGARGGGAQHAVATGATAGFMSAADKTRHDAHLNPLSVANPHTVTITQAYVAGGGTVALTAAQGAFTIDGAALPTGDQVYFETLRGAANVFAASFDTATSRATLSIGSDVAISRGAANRLDLASGDDFRLVDGEIQFAGTLETISRTAGELLLTAAQTRTTGNISVGGQVTLVADDAGDGGLVDSPGLILQANFDADPTAGVTPTAFNADIQHVMLTAGASPTSKLAFSIDGTSLLEILDSGILVAPNQFFEIDVDLDGAFEFRFTHAGGDAQMQMRGSGGDLGIVIRVTPSFSEFGAKGSRENRISSNVTDSASALVCRINNTVTLATPGARLLSVENNAVPKFQVDKDGTVEIEGDINHDGSNVGFYGTAPAAQSAAHTPTNVSTDRAYDANATTLSEIADVLGTLIADLQATGLIG